MVANEVLQSSDVSLKAKGLYAYLFSKPKDWDFSADRIKNECKEDRKAILAVLKELESLGLLVREKQADGRMEYTLVFSDSQSPELGLWVDPKSQNATVAFRHGGVLGLINNKERPSNK